MPFQNTPPPFRFSSQQRSLPPRSSAAKTPRFIFGTSQSSSSRNQFASTPRFVLSQPSRPGNSVGDDLHGSDDEPPSSFSPAPRRKGQGPCLAGEHEAIDDVEEEGEREELYSAEDESDGGVGDTENEAGSDTGNLDIDAEFDILFPSTSSRRKRRRLSHPSPPPQVHRRGADEVDQIYSASDISQPASPASPVSPVHISRSVSPQLQSPREYLNSNTYGYPSTPKPADITSKQPHQSSNHPRFVFPLNTPFQSSQNLREGTESLMASATVAASSTSRLQRNKPQFIFPRLPSPEHENPNVDAPPISIPEAFSPSRHRIGRDGQTQGNGTDFVGGGMAVEARGWILEMVAKVQQQSQLQEINRRNDLREGRDCDGTQTAKHLLTTEVRDARCGNVNAGCRGTPQMPIALARQRPATTANISSQNLLLLGPPLSVQTSSSSQVGEGNRMREYSKLQEGNSVGVRKGFTWEIELGYLNNANNGGVNRGKADPVPNSTGDEGMNIEDTRRMKEQRVANGRWLVGAEWDVL